MFRTQSERPAARGPVGSAPRAIRHRAPHRATDGDVVAELRRALDHDELRLHYQPIVDPSSGEIVGAEGLLRWQHPERGLLSPADFLAAADASEHTVDVARWVAATALAECATWPSHWCVSINLSPRQLSLGANEGLAETLVGLCHQHGLAPARLWVELTEHGLLGDGELARLLEPCRAHGIQVAIDDFGSGSASLGRLRALPLDVVKLDRSLLPDLAEADGRAGMRILRLAMELAHTVGGRVVAEGVETPEQLEALRDLGCDLVQGFHLARPMPPDQLAALAGRPLDVVVPHDHQLVLHDDEPELERCVTGFLASGLLAGSSAVVLTTGERRDGFATALRAAGLDVERLRGDRRLLELDVELLLEAIVVDGAPDPTLLGGLLHGVLQRLAAGHGPVRIYSDLTLTLWQRGQTEAALCLEDLANHLADAPPHRLLCAYPVSAFSRPGGSAGLRALRERHRHTRPSEARLAAAWEMWPSETALVQQELALLRAGH